MKNTPIEWTDHTWNPWRGCTRVENAMDCVNCYAATMGHRFGIEWGPNAIRVESSEKTWREPFRWAKHLKWDTSVNGVHGYRHPRVFALSMGDWLEDKPVSYRYGKDGATPGSPLPVGGVPTLWLARMLDTIRQTPTLNYILLTKRPQNWEQRMQDVRQFAEASVNRELLAWVSRWMHGTPPDNVCVMTSVGYQEAAPRISELLRIPARWHGLSLEPLLWPVDLSRWIGYGIANESKLGRRKADHERGCSGSVQGGRTGEGLEGESKGGKPNSSGILTTEINEEWKEGAQWRSPDRVPSENRGHTSRVDNQSQERPEGRQQTGEFGACHVQPTGNSFNLHAGKQSALSGSDWGKESCLQVDQRSSRSDQGGICGEYSGDSGNACSKVRSELQDDLEDSSRRAKVYAVGADIGLQGQEMESNSERREGKIRFLIIGGESGHGARPCNVAWIRDIRDQGEIAGCPVFVKQLGSCPVMEKHDATGTLYPLPVKLNLKHPKGGDMAEWPEDLRVRQFPEGL